MSNESTTIGWIGSLLAAFMSYDKWHSVGYAILHSLAGWIYVIYYIFAYGFPHIPK